MAQRYSTISYGKLKKHKTKKRIPKCWMYMSNVRDLFGIDVQLWLSDSLLNVWLFFFLSWSCLFLIYWPILNCIVIFSFFIPFWICLLLSPRKQIVNFRCKSFSWVFSFFLVSFYFGINVIIFGDFSLLLMPLNLMRNEIEKWPSLFLSLRISRKTLEIWSI